jgi:N-carbamoyl-L-amino-acid hydrolase
VVELRLNDKFGINPELGNMQWDWHEAMAQFSDDGYPEKGQLTVTYLTDAHRACAAFITRKMHECGFDEVSIDAVGNVVGIYKAAALDAKTLLTGSHYDTVRNGGKYDGRLGILTPMICVRELHAQGKRLPFSIEVVGFAEEEGQRYKATFLGSGALLGDFKPEWLDQKDVDGITMREAMAHAGLNVSDIPLIKRDPANYLGFVEVHIEQGPVLNALDIPLGIVTSINGNVRYLCDITGLSSHAGTTPMATRRDAAVAAAEIALYVEKRAAQDADSVGTVGMLNVPNGSINVVPGRCLFSLDLRAPLDEQRDALVKDVLAEVSAICERRGVSVTTELTERAAAAPSALVWQQRWEAAVKALGVPMHRMPSGAGHDAMKLHTIMPQAMLFVRGQNSGISHNPLESTTSDDIELGIDAFTHLLQQLANEQHR